MQEILVYNLKTNETAFALAHRFKNTSPDWTKIGKVLQDNLIRSRINDAKDDNLLGKLAEVHLRVILEQAASEDSKVILDVIPNEARKGRFRFRHIGVAGGYDVVDQILERSGRFGRRALLTQYDALLMLADLPFVLEVKMGKARNLADAFSAQRLNRILHPVSLYFQSKDLGYMVVMAADQVRVDSILQKDLTKAGGMVTHFGITAAEFLSGISHNRQSWQVRWLTQVG